MSTDDVYSKQLHEAQDKINARGQVDPMSAAFTNPPQAHMPHFEPQFEQKPQIASGAFHPAQLPTQQMQMPAHPQITVPIIPHLQASGTAPQAQWHQHQQPPFQPYPHPQPEQLPPPLLAQPTAHDSIDMQAAMREAQSLKPFRKKLIAEQSVLLYNTLTQQQFPPAPKLNYKPYTRVQYWFKAQWQSYTQENNLTFKGTPNKGKRKLIEDDTDADNDGEPDETPDDPVLGPYPYVQHEDGSFLDAEEVEDIREISKLFFEGMRLLNQTPIGWRNAHLHAVERYYAVLYKFFPFLVLCYENWKACAIATLEYPRFAKKHGLQTSRKAPSSSSDPVNKRSRTNNKFKSVSIRSDLEQY